MLSLGKFKKPLRNKIVNIQSSKKEHRDSNKAGSNNTEISIPTQEAVDPLDPARHTWNFEDKLLACSPTAKPFPQSLKDMQTHHPSTIDQEPELMFCITAYPIFNVMSIVSCLKCLLPTIVHYCYWIWMPQRRNQLIGLQKTASKQLRQKQLNILDTKHTKEFQSDDMCTVQLHVQQFLSFYAGISKSTNSLIQTRYLFYYH